MTLLDFIKKTKKLSASVQDNLLIREQITEKITSIEIWYCGIRTNQVGFGRELVIFQSSKDAEKAHGKGQIKEICIAFSKKLYCTISNNQEEYFAQKIVPYEDLFIEYLTLWNRNWDQTIIKYPKIIDALPQGNVLIPILKEFLSSRQQLEKLQLTTEVINKLKKDIVELQKKIANIRENVNLILQEIRRKHENKTRNT